MNDGFEKELFPITTMISGKYDNKSWHASGFFYHSFFEPQKQGWHYLEKTYLITNRHVVLYKDNNNEVLADSLTFNFRCIQNNNIEWLPCKLNNDELKKRVLLHNNCLIDIAIIDITDFFNNLGNNKITNNYFSVPIALSNLHLPQYQKISIDVTSDVVIASYPKGFYDKVNKFPIVKSGIIASAWGYNFNGLPLFQIDSQLFHGSSGGLVISKPTNYCMIDGKPSYSEHKQFVFLGIYSGEYQFNEELEYCNNNGNYIEIIEKSGRHFIKRSYGLGNVWYSKLIPEIIEKGVKITSN